MLRRITLVALLVTLGFVGGLVLTGTLRTANESAAVSQTPAPPQAAPGPRGGAPLPDFSGVAARTVKGVTNISSEAVVRTPNSPFASDPFFRYFFPEGDDLFGWQGRREASLGSGVVVTPNGYILTNSHVVGEHVRAATITVALADKREMRARLVGYDEMTDIALVKIDVSGLPTIPWGDSSQLRVAEWVLAIGNPFQLSQTVTLGIVSAVGRSNIGVATYEDFIQTDAAINPGNSGGALINAKGELVGINTAIYSQSGGYQGVGFAVPSNLARRVMNDLITYGEVRRGSIGVVQLMPLTSQLADQLGAPSTRGAIVAQMYRDSAAYAAGVRPGDVIVSFNGQTVEDPSHLQRLVADAKVGGTATLGIVRDGRKVETRVRIDPQSGRTRRRGI